MRSKLLVNHTISEHEALCGGRTSDSADKKVQAHLVLEDDNKYDPQAVRVDIEGKTVGYLSRETAREYRTRLRQTGHPRLVGVCKATIRGGWDRGAKDQGFYGVWLDLPST